MGKIKNAEIAYKKIPSLIETSGGFLCKEEEKMSNRISEFQQAMNAAERQGRAFADTARDLISEDETGLDSFVDMLFDFYYLTDNRQFIDFLTLLSDVYGIPLLPEIKAYGADDEKTDVFISRFLEVFFCAILAVISNVDQCS